MNLLIADDEVLTTEGLQRLNWSSIGIDEVIVAHNGTEAMKMVIDASPSILLADIEMPSFSGLELARIIQKEKFNTKVIILSGHDKFKYAQEAIKYNVCDYLLKPCSPKTIMDSVKQVVDSLNISKSNSSLYEIKGVEDSRSEDILVMKKIYEYIDNNYMHDISLVSLSEELNYSPAYLSRLIKEKSDYNFLKLVTMKRMLNAANLLGNTNMKMYMICEKIGISDQRYFSQVFKKYFGMTPLEYRRTNHNSTVSGFADFFSVHNEDSGNEANE